MRSLRAVGQNAEDSTIDPSLVIKTNRIDDERVSSYQQSSPHPGKIGSFGCWRPS